MQVEEVEQSSKITVKKVKHEIMICMFTKKLAWRVCQYLNMWRWKS